MAYLEYSVIKARRIVHGRGRGAGGRELGADLEAVIPPRKTSSGKSPGVSGTDTLDGLDVFQEPLVPRRP